MTSPAELPLVPVVAVYRDSSGQPLAGTVTFTASTVLRHAPSGSVIHPQPITVALDATGGLATSLVPTDHADVMPKQWEYRVTEALGPDAEHLTTASYTLRVPSDADTVDLSTVRP